MAASLFAFRNKFCKVLISDSNITTLESELVDSTQIAAGKKPKSESSRLRAVLFRYHEQSNSELEFEMFYKTEIDERSLVMAFAALRKNNINIFNFIVDCIDKSEYPYLLQKELDSVNSEILLNDIVNKKKA